MSPVSITGLNFDLGSSAADYHYNSAPMAGSAAAVTQLAEQEGLDALPVCFLESLLSVKRLPQHVTRHIEISPSSVNWQAWDSRTPRSRVPQVECWGPCAFGAAFPLGQKRATRTLRLRAASEGSKAISYAVQTPKKEGPTRFDEIWSQFSARKNQTSNRRGEATYQVISVSLGRR